MRNSLLDRAQRLEIAEEDSEAEGSVDHSSSGQNSLDEDETSSLQDELEAMDSVKIGSEDYTGRLSSKPILNFADQVQQAHNQTSTNMMIAPDSSNRHHESRHQTKTHSRKSGTDTMTVVESKKSKKSTHQNQQATRVETDIQAIKDVTRRKKTVKQKSHMSSTYRFGSKSNSVSVKSKIKGGARIGEKQLLIMQKDI